MALASIAPHVDDDVVVERLAVLERHLGHPCDRFGIVAVHMEDRCVDHLGDVGAVVAAERIGLVGREAELVVHDDVHGSTDGPAVEPHHVEAFGDDSLAREGGVAVDEQGDDVVPVLVVPDALLRPRPTEDDRVDELQMGGIRREGEPDVVTGAGGANPGERPVVLHVPRAADEVLLPALLEFGEELGVGLPDDVAQDVETSAVGHAHHELLDAVGRREFDDRVEKGHQRFAPLQSESLLADVAGVEEVLECLRLGQGAEEPPSFLRRVRRPIANALHPLLQPAAPLPVLDVHVLGTDVPAVGLLEDLEDVAERGGVVQRENTGVEGLVQMFVRESEALQRQILGEGTLHAERIEIRREVSDVPVVVDQRVDLALE